MQHNQIPQNPEAEAAFLGCLILNPQLMGEVIEEVGVNHFTVLNHQEVFSAIKSMYDRGNEIDSVTLSEHLQFEGYHNFSGDHSEVIGKLMDTVVSSASWGSYLDIIKEKYAARKVLEIGISLNDLARTEHDGVEGLVNKAERKLLEVSDLVNLRQDESSIGEVAKDIILSLDQDDSENYVKSGLNDLDSLIGGFWNGELTIIAGRPSMGKTTLAMNIAYNAANDQKVPVLVFSLEVAKKQLVQNMLCSKAGVNGQKLRTRNIDDFSRKKLFEASNDVFQLPIYIDDLSYQDISRVKSRARRLKIKRNIGLIVIDYIQLVDSLKGSSEMRANVLADISKGLKSLARELNIPIIALAQLNRAVEAREGKPRMSDLRESGSLEQDADTVMLLYSETYNKPDVEDKGFVELIVGKQRNGPVGTVKVRFVKEMLKFEDYVNEELEFAEL